MLYQMQMAINFIVGGISWHLDRPYAYHAIQENGEQLKGLVISDSTIME